MNSNILQFSQVLELAEFPIDQLFAHLEEAIRIGSASSMLSWADFDFKVNDGVKIDTVIDILSAVNAGMYYLDAVYYFNCPGKPASIAITNRKKEQKVTVNYKAICQGVFAWYFSLYNQARGIGAGSNNFLTNVLSLGPDWALLVKSLTSANIENFPKKWINNVTFDDLSDESKNRLALGAAGHRYLQALTFIKDSDYKPNMRVHKTYIDGLKSWTKSRVYWDLHPIYKSSNLITITKSLNKSIEDCLAKCLTDDAKLKLAASKVLNHQPIEQPAHSQWETFDLSSLPILENPIFPVKTDKTS